MACKLYRQFAHASSEKLLKLLKSAGKPWCHDKEPHNEILKVSKNCNICKLYKKPSPRPVFGMRMDSRFQECVASSFTKVKSYSIQLTMPQHYRCRLLSQLRIQMLFFKPFLRIGFPFTVLLISSSQIMVGICQ